VVVDQEAEQSRAERAEHHRFRMLVVEEEVDGKRAGCDRRDSRRQTVHVVEHVHGVGDADQPDERDGHVQDRPARPRKHEPEEDDRRRAQQLTDELLIRLEVQEVIDQAEDEQRRAGAEDRPGLAGLRNREHTAPTVAR
jgi:hypothetical protein